MAKPRATIRYQIHASPDYPGMWAIIDIFTGQPTVVNGVKIDCASVDEVDELVDLLNRKDFEERGLLRPGP